MPSYPVLGTQVIGQAESALGAILGPLLAPTGTTFGQWLVLMCKYGDVRIWSVQPWQEPSTMTGSPPRLPQRSHARSNRARILAAAREELSRDPDVSLDEIARAAGVVRRTLYGHFPNRQALIDALAAEAKQSLEEAVAAARRPDADPPTALARLILASWPVGDRYRMLISLAHRNLREERLRAALAPARAEATAILERGQREGIFASHLPADILALATESVALAVLESQTPGHWGDPTGEAGATAVLIAAGIDLTSARRYVHAILSEDAQPAPA